jgi:hypothetical protein
MARFKNYLLVALGFGFAGAIGAAFGTGTAQAVVSTLVSVVNPSTSPVPISNVNDPGRVAYQAQVPTLQGCNAANDCTYKFPTVPAGHRVVVQHISGEDELIGQPTYFKVFASLSSGGFPISSFLPPLLTAQEDYEFDQPVSFYVDSGDSVQVELRSNSAFAGMGAVTLTGYEVDCTVAACAPIATQ